MRGGRSDGYTDKVGGAICEVGGAMDILTKWVELYCEVGGAMDILSGRK